MRCYCRSKRSSRAASTIPKATPCITACKSSSWRRDELPYDEEFLLAALLHDVGKAIEPHDHVAAALEALAEFITPRTAWLIEHHMEGHALHEGTIGPRARRRLEESPDYDELVLLSRCDRGGRVRGAQVPDVEEALDYIRELARVYG